MKVVTEPLLEQFGVLLEKSEQEVVKDTNGEAPTLHLIKLVSSVTGMNESEGQQTFIVCMNSAIRFLIFSKLSALSTSGRAFNIRFTAVWHIESQSSSTY